jgi:molybdopterin converting factor small subunit
MEIQLKLYGSSKILSDKDTLNIQLPNNSNIEKVRDILTKIISEKYSKSNLKNLPKTAAFFSEKDVVVNDNYKLKDKESISIIPPIGGG